MRSNLIFDLDGVVYLGDQPVSGAGETLERLHAAGHHILFCTNNASRTRSQSAEKIRRVTGYPASPDQVASSAMAAGRLVPESARVLMVGGDGVAEAINDRNGILVDEVDADTVVVGIDFSFTYDKLDLASAAVRNGAVFIATNRDLTNAKRHRQSRPHLFRVQLQGFHDLGMSCRSWLQNEKGIGSSDWVLVISKWRQCS